MNYKLIANAIIALRADWGRYFPSIEGDEAAWEMMLTLFVLDLDGRTSKSSELSILSGVGLLIGRRCIRDMLAQGLIRKFDDGQLELTEPALQKIKRYFDAVDKSLH